jgi:GntR family transcriptional regulator, carbon starvation induced regulator
MRRSATSAPPARELDLQAVEPASASKTLAGAVLASMRSDILELKLAPGSKLPFEALRERYDAGFSPLRESLSRLVVEGLVVGEDQRGFRVAPLTVEDFIDLTTLRREIEVMAVVRSVERGGDAWEADLVRAFHHMLLASSPVVRGYPTEWARRHKAFHEALVAACGSPRLLLLRRQLFDHFMRYQRVAPRHVWKNSIRDTEHKKMVDAAVARNIDKVSALARAHIRVLDEIVDGVKAYQSKMGA